MTENKTGYKYRIGFSQSLSTGIIAFEGNIQYDNVSTTLQAIKFLPGMLQDVENSFKKNGFRVASDIAPKILKEKEITK